MGPPWRGDGRPQRALARFNARHPWSHNDHFHGWIVRQLPTRRDRALDVGCGEGRLLRRLAGEADRVHGTDRDASMRAAARARCAGLERVTVGEEGLTELTGPYHVVTMVAVLHHLDPEPALTEVRRLLAPGGRLLVVGLARPDGLLDAVVDLASSLLNPLVGLVRHPRAVRGGATPPAYPVRDPVLTFRETGAVVRAVLPGARLRRRLFFRFTLVWTRPAG